VHSRLVSAVELGLSPEYTFADLLGSNSSAFIYEKQGLIGWGEELRLETTGPNRVIELDSLWRELVAGAEITNEVNLSGSGLISFGSIAFSDKSKTTSVLVIPKVVVGKQGETLWLTTINIDDADALKLINLESTYTSVSFEPGQISPDQYKLNVDRALEVIDSGVIEKVVLARDLSASESKDFNINPALRKLEKKCDSCYIYSVDGMFGASPELLVKVSHSEFSARVLAGTAGRGTDPGVDQAIGSALNESPKNRAEHKFAIDSLVESLSEFTKEITVDSEPFSIALPNLWHLASDVKAMLSSDSTSLQVVNALHPSAAVAGTPRDKALEVIEEIENVDRGRYAGPVGWIDARGDGEIGIALRTGELSDDQKSMRIFSGCGIVAGSNPEDELAESQAKLSPMRTALEMWE
jgi:menaquinone-specific isochorismate synthase